MLLGGTLLVHVGTLDLGEKLFDLFTVGADPFVLNGVRGGGVLSLL